MKYIPLLELRLLSCLQFDMKKKLFRVICTKFDNILRIEKKNLTETLLPPSSSSERYIYLEFRQ